MIKSTLVIFSKDLPKKSQSWWQQFDTLIAPKQLKEVVQKYKLHFVDLDTLIDPGSVEEASDLTKKLSILEDPNGKRISKIINYKGFELWWINYDSLMYNFCLPYTQYRRLLEYLVDFSNIYLYEPPFSRLFSYFLDSYNCRYKIKIKDRFKKILPFGVLFQVFLSILFLVWIKLRQPKLMLWTSDKFDPPRDHDFRLKFIYKELRHKNINFVEFIRSLESFRAVFKHAIKRKRPVIYSYAIVTLVRSATSIFSKKNKNKVSSFFKNKEINSEQRFWFLIATNYLHDIKGDIYAIRVIKFIIKFIGIKSSIIDAGVNRNFHEVLACKLLNIPIVGILHGAACKHYNIYDFMPNFNGTKMLSVDKYGLWSEWWKEFYIKNSKAYKPEQLFVSGPMRPTEKVNQNIIQNKKEYEGPVRILFISEQLAIPSETFPYLETLLQLPHKDFILSFRFRPYKDGFKNWLVKNRPDFLKQNDITVSGGELQDAIKNSDIVVGSNSTAVLEALFQYKIPLLFKTQKWGDVFDLENYGEESPFFAKNPDELIKKIKNSWTIQNDDLDKLQKRFFGDPSKNGSKWVVDEAIKNI